MEHSISLPGLPWALQWLFELGFFPDRFFHLLLLQVVAGNVLPDADLCLHYVFLWLSCAVIFVLAWIGQFYGHKVEGKKPSFLEDVKFLLIGPIWLLHFFCKKVGLKY
jgi:uncharacterized membrane protein YGL010W